MSPAARARSAERMSSPPPRSPPRRISPARKPLLRMHDEDELVHTLKE